MALVDLAYETVNERLIAYLYMNNPSTKNSMTWEMSQEFRAQVEKLKSLENQPSCVILTGKNHIFSSGGDLGLLRSFKDNTLEENKKKMYEFYNNFLCIRELSIPTVAAVNGHAMGAAFSLALACDIRIFAVHGKYSFNFVKLGIHPGMGSSYLVKELFGKDMANYLLLMGETITGEEARAMRICHDAVQLEEVNKRAMEFAITLSESAPMALSLLKETFNSYAELQEALKREAEAQSKCFLSQDFLESLQAIEEKRKPVFKGK